MTWIRLEHTFPDHPKIDALTDGAFRLHVTAICWSGDLLTDGFIPTDRVPRLIRRYKASYLKELTTVHLGCTSAAWDQVDGGYQIHDYLDFQQSAAQVKADRAANAERQRRWKESRRNKPTGNPEGNDATNTVTDRKGNGRVTPLVTGDRSRSRSDVVPNKSRSSHQGVAANGQGKAGPAHAEPQPPNPDDGWGNPEATGPDEGPDQTLQRRAMAIRWRDVLAGHGTTAHLHECNAVIAQALHDVDHRIIDEQIGWQLQAETPPRTPAVLLAAIRRVTR